MKRKQKKQNDEIRPAARGQDRDDDRLGSGKLEQGRGKHEMRERSHENQRRRNAQTRCATVSARTAVIAMMLVAMASIGAVVVGFGVGVNNGIGIRHGDRIGWIPVSTGKDKLGSQKFWRNRTFDIAWESGLDKAGMNLRGLSVEDLDKAEMQQKFLNAMELALPFRST